LEDAFLDDAGVGRVKRSIGQCLARQFQPGLCGVNPRLRRIGCGTRIVRLLLRNEVFIDKRFGALVGARRID
jgi:hypothetical protein